jgi:hypothetical protein
MTVHDECKGCYTYMYRIKNYPDEENACDPLEIKNCPCRICIVKSMCNSECKDYTVARTTAIGEKDEEDWIC